MILFVGLALLALDPGLLRTAFANRAAMHDAMTRYPDRGWEGYPSFLEGVRARTKPGDTIALVVPGSSWDRGYSYAYYRASYFLTGREVLPVIDSDDTPQPGNLARAKCVVVWRRSGGTLLRR